MQRLALFMLSSLIAVPGFAWDPNEGASYTPPAGRAPTYGYYHGVASTRPAPAAPTAITYSPAPATASYLPSPAIAPAPAAYTPPAVIAPPPAAPAYVAPAPQVAATPTYTYYAPAPTEAEAAPIASGYAIAPVPGTEQRWDTPHKPADRLALGVELFYDNYKEPDVDLDNDAVFGSLTADYQHFFDTRWFGGIDARASYGQEDYSSPTGEIDGIPQWEFEGRAKGGYRFYDGASTIDLYSGLGARYFRDDFKGENATVGGITYMGYDRRIFQAYLPVGITHTSTQGSWTIRKNLEADALLYGNVSSRLGTIPGFGNVENDQDPFSGWGARGELMLGKVNAQGYGYEFGPFFRYWWVDDSNTEFDGVSGGTYLEPENTRLQIGATARWLF